MWKYTVLFGLLLVGSLGLAQAPPAEDEIASMQAAFGEVTGRTSKTWDPGSMTMSPGSPRLNR